MSIKSKLLINKLNVYMNNLVVNTYMYAFKKKDIHIYKNKYINVYFFFLSMSTTKNIV